MQETPMVLDNRVYAAVFKEADISAIEAAMKD